MLCAQPVTEAVMMTVSLILLMRFITRAAVPEAEETKSDKE